MTDPHAWYKGPLPTCRGCGREVELFDRFCGDCIDDFWGEAEPESRYTITEKGKAMVKERK